VKRRLTLAIAALAAFGLIAGFATNASAFPTKTTACSGCHSGPTLTVTATQTSNDGVTAAYTVSAPGAYYIAVFDGTTKTAQITGASGTASLTVGHTYTLRAVEGPTTSSGYGQLVVTPVAPIVTPPADTVAPVTTSDALATYVTSAAIHLSATDNAGGTGVAATYYILDSGTQTAGTVVNVSALGSHTLKFWSVDVTGNIEAQKTASFTITAPVVLDTTAPVTTSDALSTYVSSAAIHLSATDSVGGSGVAATYYVLDGGSQTAGTMVNVSVVGNHTLEFWSVDVAGNVEAHNSVSFTVTAPLPTPDTIAPVTLSNALATYVSSAVINLSATDNVGGSGVAATYYVLDGGSQTAGTVVTVGTVGDHTLAFWSVDAAGNTETANTVDFAVTAPVVTPEPTTTPTPGDSDDPTSTPVPSGIAKVTVHVMGTNSHDLRGATVTLVNTETGAIFTVKTNKHGNAILTGVPFGTYTVTATSGRTLAKGTLKVTKSSVKLNLRVRNVRSIHHD